MGKILLLNPPGDKLYLRDYYCSHISKANYYWPPFDLMVQSGFLKRDFELEVLDANVLGLSEEETLLRIRKMNIDALLFLTGGVSWKKDFAFLKKLKREKPIPSVGIGDILFFSPQKFLQEYLFLDGVLLDFTSPSFSLWLKRKENIPFEDFVYRERGEIIEGGRTKKKVFSYPSPHYFLFPLKKYRLPYSLYRLFLPCLTDFGCPFSCPFCVGGKLGYKLRDLDNLLEDLSCIHSLGIRQIRFKDLTFGARREHTISLCEEMIKRKFHFKWICISRVDVLDEELLSLMKKAGCYLIQLGVETGEEKILKKYKKGITLGKVKETFRVCKKLKIQTLAHFILGLPEEREETLLRTIEFAKELDPDYASFNLAAPKAGTELREEALEKGYLKGEEDEVDNSLLYPSLETPLLSREALWRLRNKAIKEFYLRPSYLVKRLLKVRTFYGFKTLFREGISLLGTLSHG